MNIPEQIWNAAKRRNLDWIATGGGFDFIYLDLSDKSIMKKLGNIFRDFPCAILACQDDAGSPEKLDERCAVTIYIDDNWTQYISLHFDTVVEALDFMGAVKGGDFTLPIPESAKGDGAGGDVSGAFGQCAQPVLPAGTLPTDKEGLLIRASAQETWLEFKNPDGSRGSINLRQLAEERPPITKAAILQWCERMGKEAK